MLNVDQERRIKQLKATFWRSRLVGALCAVTQGLASYDYISLSNGASSLLFSSSAVAVGVGVTAFITISLSLFVQFKVRKQLLDLGVEAS